MTELVNGSTELANDLAAEYAADLLRHYSFDLGGYTIDQLFLYWQENYPMNWIRLATIEALYQGRYKAISVEQILALWRRRSQPLYHFNHEFERLVCENLPQNLAASSEESLAKPSALAAVANSNLSYHSAVLQLPSFKATARFDSEVSLALKTLSGEPLADVATAETVTTTEPLAAQTYSYNLRSEAQQTFSSTEDDDQTPTPELDADQFSEDGKPQDEKSGDVDNHAEGDRASSAIQPTQAIEVSDTPVDSDAAAVMQPTVAQGEAIAKILQQLGDQELSARTVLPGFGLMAHTLKPKLMLDLTTRYQPSWLTDTSSKQPIHQFTPDSESSDFHSKLKAVAQPPEDTEGFVPPSS